MLKFSGTVLLIKGITTSVNYLSDAGRAGNSVAVAGNAAFTQPMRYPFAVDRSVVNMAAILLDFAGNPYVVPPVDPPTDPPTIYQFVVELLIDGVVQPAFTITFNTGDFGVKGAIAGPLLVTGLPAAQTLDVRVTAMFPFTLLFTVPINISVTIGLAP
jgi:hypothetical protein